ncbi:hypothetical protein GCM10023063_15980 [Arthrobacter methylotrophus]|uniref:Uncharacterized protein n=1 Tax=Arthrobacter methylotrophus TaxID=121291 RepID=A0ABV5URJ1_9MICC
MANLHADLTKLLARHRASRNQDFTGLLTDIQMAVDDAGTPEYQYRNHPSWDTTWMDLDESQIGVVLKQGHSVERRLILGGWEAVTEVPRVSD